MDPTRLYHLITTFSHLYPTLYPIYRGYKSSLSSVHCKKLHLGFLRKCYDEKVIPKHLLPSRFQNMDNLPFGVMEKEILRRTIQDLKKEIKHGFYESSIKKGVFNQCIPEVWKNTLLDNIFDDLRKKCDKVKSNFNKKVINLIKNSLWNLKSDPNNVLNLSSKQISEDHHILQGYI